MKRPIWKPAVITVRGLLLVDGNNALKNRAFLMLLRPLLYKIVNKRSLLRIMGWNRTVGNRMIRRTGLCEFLYSLDTF